MKSYDVVIAGGGIIGLSIAWQIARRSRLRVLVAEKGRGLGEGSTGASSAICRCRYSIDEMVALARDSIALYRDWPSFTRLADPRARLNEDGVLWLTAETGWADAQHARMSALGVATEVLDDTALADRFPALSPCVIAPDLESGEDHECTGGGRHLLETRGGWVDPVSAAQDLAEACQHAGVDIWFGAPVTDVVLAGGRVAGAAIAGVEISCATLVNATGPWFRHLNDAVGLDTGWDLAPVRIQVMYRDWPRELGPLPATCDLQAGIYFRGQNQGQQVLVSTIRGEDEREVVADPDTLQTAHDHEFEITNMHALHHRIPGLPARGRIRGYCGMYTMNRDDVHPVVGATEVYGYWLANGFSGHGFKLAPAVGAMVAQGITGTVHDDDSAVPATLFAVGREPIELASRSVLA